MMISSVPETGFGGSELLLTKMSNSFVLYMFPLLVLWFLEFSGFQKFCLALLINLLLQHQTCSCIRSTISCTSAHNPECVFFFYNPLPDLSHAYATDDDYDDRDDFTWTELRFDLSRQWLFFIPSSIWSKPSILCF